MEVITNDSSAACGQSVLTDEFGVSAAPRRPTFENNMDVVINGITYRPIAPMLPKGLTLGQFLKATRKALGVTLDHASFDMGCSKSYLWELENDKGEPSLRIAARIAKTYGIPLEEVAQHLTPNAK